MWFLKRQKHHRPFGQTGDLGFVKNQHTVGIFFDLEKAYDTTWKGGIMKDLHEMGLKGGLPLFIDNFLKGRKFQ